VRYLKFIVNDYRAITGPLEIDIANNSLVPIIGVNESGKTTILHSLFAFDHTNDKLNHSGRHLEDAQNLYSAAPPAATISAEIEISVEEFRARLKVVARNTPTLDGDVRAYLRLAKQVSGRLVIVRDLVADRYDIKSDLLSRRALNDALGREIVMRLPYILFFDDFRDSIEDEIEIKKDTDGEAGGWLAILQQLFIDTDSTYSVFALIGMEERRRKAVLARVERRLNDALTREWQTFNLEDVDALKIGVVYHEDTVAGGQVRAYLKLEVVETDLNDDKHFFFIRDRSKGFFWFFNFVMKLEFNPKVLAGSDVDAIYLLDEPGSYLHAAAQTRLCKKLRQLSERNKVVYCTHSLYLLDPELIPVNTIRIADKDGHGRVTLTSIHSHKGNILDRRSAYQPLLDALQVRPFALDLTHEKVLIVEGIIDYYSFEMFKTDQQMGVLPSVGADSIKFYVSLMIAWRRRYCALWDNDPEGRGAKLKTEKHFGAHESRRFYLLPRARGSRSDRKAQNLFDGRDLSMIRDRLGIPMNSSFEKTVTALFYSTIRSSVLENVSSRTRANFDSALSQCQFE